jgi:mycothiol synthase
MTIWTMRAPTTDDLEAIITLLNAEALVEEGFAQYNAADLRNDWEMEGYDINEYTRICHLSDGRIIAYAELHGFTDEQPVDPYFWFSVAPEMQGQGIEVALRDWAEATVRRLALPRLAEDLQLALTSSSVRGFYKASFLQSWGFVHRRTFYRMVIDLPTPPPTPSLPTGFSLRQSDGSDADIETAYHVFDQSFRDHFGYVVEPFEVKFPQWKHHMTYHEDYQPSYWWLAIEDATGKAVGITLGHPNWQHQPERAYVNEVGVLSDYRGKGLAQALLQAFFGYAYQHGQTHIALGVDADSLTGATRLYERVGMRADKLFDMYELVLRAGRDLRKQ